MATPMIDNRELLQVAEAVAREKQISREEVLEAMEQAVQVAGRRKYGHEHDIRAVIDRKTGNMQLFRVTTVVETMEPPEEETPEGETADTAAPPSVTENDEEAPADDVTKILLEDAKKIDPNLEIGDEIRDELPPIDFGRVAALTAKQVIMQRVRDSERERQYEEFKDRVGDVINGIVERVEYGNAVVRVGQAEAILRREEIIPRENFRQGERVRAIITDVRRERTGPQIFLSRTHPSFLIALFAQEVPEVYDGIIEIRSAARDPGSRAKITVFSKDSGIDPVGSCVGVRGSRVQAVVGELQGERVDIIPWTSDIATLTVNALSPAEVSKVVMDEDRHCIEVIVGEDQQSLAIGRRGQNVRLASQLVGWDIDILTEEDESRRRTEEFHRVSQIFIDALNVEDVIAHLLVTEGFTSLEDVAYVPLEDLATIEGFDEDIAGELRARAREAIERGAEELGEQLDTLGVEPELRALEGMTNTLLMKLADKGITTRDDLGDLARDEFHDLLPESGLKDDEVDQLIMRARSHWFEKEEADASSADATEPAKAESVA